MRKTQFQAKKVILGIDPGSRITGFGVIELENDQLKHITHGVIQLSADENLEVRLVELGQSLKELLLKYNPQEIVIEKIFLGKNADSAFKLGHARGVVMYEGKAHGCHVTEYATRAVKKSVTGNGGASKEDVQFVLQHLLRVPKIQRIDASDALAMACHRAFEIKRDAVLEVAT